MATSESYGRLGSPLHVCPALQRVRHFLVMGVDAVKAPLRAALLHCCVANVLHAACCCACCVLLCCCAAAAAAATMPCSRAP